MLAPSGCKRTNTAVRDHSDAGSGTSAGPTSQPISHSTLRTVQPDCILHARVDRGSLHDAGGAIAQGAPEGAYSNGVHESIVLGFRQGVTTCTAPTGHVRSIASVTVHTTVRSTHMR